MLLAQEGRIEILRPVAEEVEAGHQYDREERQFPVCCNGSEQAHALALFHDLERGRFGHV